MINIKMDKDPECVLATEWQSSMEAKRASLTALIYVVLSTVIEPMERGDFVVFIVERQLPPHFLFSIARRKAKSVHMEDISNTEFWVNRSKLLKKYGPGSLISVSMCIGFACLSVLYDAESSNTLSNFLMLDVVVLALCISMPTSVHAALYVTIFYFVPHAILVAAGPVLRATLIFGDTNGVYRYLMWSLAMFVLTLMHVLMKRRSMTELITSRQATAQAYRRADSVLAKVIPSYVVDLLTNGDVDKSNNKSMGGGGGEQCETISSLSLPHQTYGSVDRRLMSDKLAYTAKNILESLRKNEMPLYRDVSNAILIVIRIVPSTECSVPICARCGRAISLLSANNSACNELDLCARTYHCPVCETNELMTNLDAIFSQLDRIASDCPNITKIVAEEDRVVLAVGLEGDGLITKPVIEFYSRLYNQLRILRSNSDVWTRYGVCVGMACGPVLAGVLGKLLPTVRVIGVALDEALHYANMAPPGTIMCSGACMVLFDGLASFTSNSEGFFMVIPTLVNDTTGKDDMKSEDTHSHSGIEITSLPAPKLSRITWKFKSSYKTGDNVPEAVVEDDISRMQELEFDFSDRITDAFSVVYRPMSILGFLSHSISANANYSSMTFANGLVPVLVFVSGAVLLMPWAGSMIFTRGVSRLTFFTAVIALYAIVRMSIFALNVYNLGAQAIAYQMPNDMLLVMTSFFALPLNGVQSLSYPCGMTMMYAYAGSLGHARDSVVAMLLLWCTYLVGLSAASTMHKIMRIAFYFNRILEQERRVLADLLLYVLPVHVIDDLLAARAPVGSFHQELPGPGSIATDMRGAILSTHLKSVCVLRIVFPKITTMITMSEKYALWSVINVLHCSLDKLVDVYRFTKLPTADSSYCCISGINVELSARQVCEFALAVRHEIISLNSTLVKASSMVPIVYSAAISTGGPMLAGIVNYENGHKVDAPVFLAWGNPLHCTREMISRGPNNRILVDVNTVYYSNRENQTKPTSAHEKLDKDVLQNVALSMGNGQQISFTVSTSGPSSPLSSVRRASVAFVDLGGSPVTVSQLYADPLSISNTTFVLKSHQENNAPVPAINYVDSVSPVHDVFSEMRKRQKALRWGT